MLKSVGWRATDGNSDYKEFIRVLQSAVSNELTAQNARSREQVYNLKDGIYLSRSINFSTYSFLSYPDMQLEADSAILVEIDGKSIEGYVVSAGEESIDLALRGDFGGTIKEARITGNAAAVYQQLKNRFDEILSGKEKYNSEGCMKLFGFKEPNLTGTKLIHVPKIKGLNDEQTDAVHKALSQETTFIWGPPGTGKTHTINIILKRLVQQNKNVLFVSRTNESVDDVLKVFATDFENKAVVDRGKIIRHGIIGSPDILLNNFIIENIQINKYWKVHDVIDRHLAEIHENESLIIQYREIFESEQYREITAIDETLIGINALIKQMKAELAETHKKIAALDQEINMITESRRNAGPLNRLNKLFSSGDDTFNSALLMDRDNLIVIEKKRLVMLGALTRQTEDLKDKANKARDIIFTKYRSMDISTIRRLPEIIDSMKARIEIEKVSIEKANKELASYNETLLNEAQVIGCTISRCYTDPAIYSRRFDAIVVDDSSIVSLPELFFVAGLASQYVLCGDFRMLPPHAKSAGETTSPWLKREIFDQAGIIESIQQGIEDNRFVMLREQYAIHPDIINITNNAMYAGQIKSDNVNPDILAIAGRGPFEGYSVVMCDTSRLNPWCSRKVNGSQFNPYTALLSVGLTEAAVSGGQKEVVIVTTQKAQAQLIDTLLKNRKIPEKSACVSTIQQYNGPVKDCMILDLVEGPPYDISPLLSQSEIGSMASKYLNMIISKARGKLIVIANREYLQERLTPGTLAYELISGIESNHTIFDSADMITSYSDIISEEFNGADQQDEDLIMFNEQEFFPTFIRDINHARNRIIIFSPFMSEEGMGILFPRLKAAAEKGISVYLITREPGTYSKEPTFKNMIEEVRQSGIHVIIGSEAVGLSDTFHEKLVIIDDNIMYFGTMNILARDSTPGVMLEISNNEIIDNLVKNYRIDSIISKHERSVRQAKK